MSVDILKDQLKNKSLGNLYLLYGPEEYLKKYYLDAIEKQIVSEDMRSLNRILLEGKVEVGSIMDNCETLPVFSDRKLVVVKNSGLFKSKGKANQEGKGKNKKDDLIDYLQTIPLETCLVFFEEEIDKRMKAVDIIKKKGLIVEFPFQKSAELVKWVTKAFKTNGKNIDSITASQLVDNCEQGMTEILNEINKVVLYLGNRDRVTGLDIEKVCTKSVKTRIFDLTDAISEKNSSKALKLLDDMLVLKEPMPKILFMIARQFRQILEMKLLCSNGLKSTEAAAKMGITPYAAGKIQKQVSGFSVEILKEAVEECLNLDISIKTGKINDRIAAELLIAKYSNV